ncbi:MAG: HD domain-containing protein [Firmicutes bacterium]|nr:HD domain-containing protein [Bacillota bacterium]
MENIACKHCGSMTDNIKKIILADSCVSDLVQGERILKPFYEIISVSSIFELFEALKNMTPDIILLNLTMGGDVINRLKEDARLQDVPVIFLTALGNASSQAESFGLGAADCVTKPFLPPLLLKRIEKELLFAQQTKELVESKAKLDSLFKSMETMVGEKVAEVVQMQNAVLATVTDLVEFRDKHTGGHIVRTQLYIKELVKGMFRRGVYSETISGWDVNALLASSQLHDVGKIAISDNILCKPGKLTEGEFENMKDHVSAGVEAIKRILDNTSNPALLAHALAIAGTHHEKWDGTGYPSGLKGEQIPLEGRIMAIADVYDALITTRSYKESLTHEEAAWIIESGSGTQFDPLLIGVFKDVKKEFAVIAARQR